MARNAPLGIGPSATPPVWVHFRPAPSQVPSVLRNAYCETDGTAVQAQRGTAILVLHQEEWTSEDGYDALGDGVRDALRLGLSVTVTLHNIEMTLLRYQDTHHSHATKSQLLRAKPTPKSLQYFQVIMAAKITGSDTGTASATTTPANAGLGVQKPKAFDEKGAIGKQFTGIDSFNFLAMDWYQYVFYSNEMFRAGHDWRRGTKARGPIRQRGRCR
jgi:hypothetical protein